MDLQLQRYNQHKNGAEKRGVPFDLTFDEWKDIWDGKFHNRGRGSDQLGMLRTRDEGGYAKGNVRLGTPKENQQEAAVVRAVKKVTHGAAYFPRASVGYNSLMESRSRVFDEYVEEDEYSE